MEIFLKYTKMFFLSVIFLVSFSFPLYILLLCYPGILFSHKISHQNIIVYSDEELPKEIYPLLDSVQRRISKSPLYQKHDVYKVFICNNETLFKFFVRNQKAAGLNYGYLNQNSFLTRCNIKENRLYKSGKKIGGDRTLVYYISHEITHAMTVRHVGRINFFFLPVWIREGYADYVGFSEIDFTGQLEKYKKGNATFDFEKSLHYDKYSLLVSYLLDVKKIPLEELWLNNYDGQQVEAELKKRN